MYSLEPCAVKVASTVLRGGGYSDMTPLPDYHRKLRRLVAIELKIGPFKPDYKGQMELYLSWLDKNEREQHEEAPIGLILCSDADADEIELMGLDQGDIRVARYITQTLPPPVLEKKLREIVSRNRELIARREGMKQLEAGSDDGEHKG
jgi:hypothetical protein